MRELGLVKQVQIQCSSLKVFENSVQFYDSSPLLPVTELILSPQGIIGVLEDGEQIVDVHNADHPNSKYARANGVSVGFTSHYAAMREKFGDHLTDGIAGENILVEFDSIVKLDDLGKQLVFQNPATGEQAYLHAIIVAPPCEPFSRFALRQSPPVPAPVMKSTLQFLDGGVRAFYANGLGGRVTAGDKVFVDEG